MRKLLSALLVVVAVLTALTRVFAIVCASASPLSTATTLVQSHSLARRGRFGLLRDDAAPRFGVAAVV